MEFREGSMEAGMMLRFSASVPDNLRVRFRFSARAEYNLFTFYDLQTIDLPELTEAFTPYRNQILHGPHFFLNEERKEIGRNSEFVGYVLDAAEGQCNQNPPEDFEVFWSDKCGGVLRDGIAIRCEKKPTHAVESVGEETIYSAKMIRLFKKIRACEIQRPVTWKGQDQPYYSCAWIDKVSVILPTSLNSWRVCPKCGVEEPTNSGIFLGEVEPEVRMGKDVIAWGHAGKSHPIVVSREFAWDLVQEIRTKTFLLTPILSAQSLIGQFVQGCIDFFKPHQRSNHRLSSPPGGNGA